MKGLTKDLYLAEEKISRMGWVIRKKYHMIKWDALDKPKEFGGLGFIDTRAMNTGTLG